MEGSILRLVKQDDYRYCEDCQTVFDFWKFDSLADAGHDGHKVRMLTFKEFVEAVKACREAGCFDEQHLDSKHERTCVQCQ